MKKIIFLILISLSIIPLAGCSVRQAASINKPKYEADLLTFGRPRSHVLTQLGSPLKSKERNGYIIDTYEMSRNSKGWGYARAGGYTFLDVGTFGLWELIGTPLEDFIQQEQTVTIYYDQNNQIERIDYARN